MPKCFPKSTVFAHTLWCFSMLLFCLFFKTLQLFYYTFHLGFERLACTPCLFWIFRLFRQTSKMKQKRSPKWHPKWHKNAQEKLPKNKQENKQIKGLKWLKIGSKIDWKSEAKLLGERPLETKGPPRAPRSRKRHLWDPKWLSRGSILVLSCRRRAIFHIFVF